MRKNASASSRDGQDYGVGRRAQRIGQESTIAAHAALAMQPPPQLQPETVSTDYEPTVCTEPVTRKTLKLPAENPRV
jgi:hypothetical protein